MKLDIGALERMTDLDAPPINGDELAALVRIARAAVAWRDGDYCAAGVNDQQLLDALREAGL